MSASDLLIVLLSMLGGALILALYQLFQPRPVEVPSIEKVENPPESFHPLPRLRNNGFAVEIGRVISKVPVRWHGQPVPLDSSRAADVTFLCHTMLAFDLWVGRDESRMPHLFLWPGTVRVCNGILVADLMVAAEVNHLVGGVPSIELSAFAPLLPTQS